MMEAVVSFVESKRKLSNSLNRTKQRSYVFIGEPDHVPFVLGLCRNRLSAFLSTLDRHDPSGRSRFKAKEASLSLTILQIPKHPCWRLRLSPAYFAPEKIYVQRCYENNGSQSWLLFNREFVNSRFPISLAWFQ